MAILGINIDVVQLPRVLALLNSRRSDVFASRILSTTEYGQWQALQISDAQDRAQFLAVRYQRLKRRNHVGTSSSPRYS